MTSRYKRFKEKKQAFLELAGVDSNNQEARRLVQAAREMVAAEMEYKGMRNLQQPNFGNFREWIRWLCEGGTRQ